MKTLAEQVAEEIAQSALVSPGDRVGVAVSGGADSVVLLHVLSELAVSFKIELSLLHVNHRLRGAESDADEEFVRQLAESLQLPIFVDRPELLRGNLEQEARLARRRYFLLCINERIVDRVALGHTRSDQAETVLYRLFRGAGLAGLSGMRTSTEEGLIRPLLRISRDSIREWAKSRELVWRDDTSNADPTFRRNYLRTSTIPLLCREFNGNLEGVLSGMAHVAQAEEDYWSQLIQPIYSQIADRSRFGLVLDLSVLKDLHLAIQRRVIRRALGEVRGDLRSIDLEHVSAILRVCAGSSGHDRVIVPGADALRSYEKLRLVVPSRSNSDERHYRRELVVGQQCELPYQIGSICVDLTNQRSRNCGNFKDEPDSITEAGGLERNRTPVSVVEAEVVELDGEILLGSTTPRPVCVRNWEPGDEILRPGHKKAEKLKTLFQEFRVLLWERRHWPVVEVDGEIVWTRHFGGSVRFLASPATREVARLSFRLHK